jgi:hypothetical protein
MDGHHNPETVIYMVMEKGVHSLSQDMTVQAGSITTGKVHRGGKNLKGEQVNFPESFDCVPAVFHSLNTYNNKAFMSSCAAHVSKTGFRLEQEALETGVESTSEEIAWIAFETGSFDGLVIAFEDDGNHNSHTIYYDFDVSPDIVVKGNSMNGPNGYWTRSSGLFTSKRHGFFVEDTVQDAEQSHVTETLALVVAARDTDFVAL